MNDLISRQAAIDALGYCQTYLFDSRDKDKKISLEDAEYAIEQLPSAQPDFSCDGCKTPKHICGICMRNYPNITDHYCTGEWAERREE